MLVMASPGVRKGALLVLGSAEVKNKGTIKEKEIKKGFMMAVLGFRIAGRK
jgi:hypothetical protein